MDHPIHSPSAPTPVGAYPHARRVGPLLFLSGIGPREPGTDRIPGAQLDAQGRVIDYDFAAQCHSVFRNVKTVLQAAGADWNDLVDVTVFLTDLPRDFGTMNAIYAEYFREVQPCRTTIGVQSLPTPIAIELKCIAAIPLR